MRPVDGARRREWIAGTFLLVLTLINVATTYQLLPLLRKGYQDFTAFYTAGMMIRTGQAARLYDLHEQTRLQQQFAPNVAIRQGALPYNHPPFEALLFVPLAYLSYGSAYLLWTLLNGGMLLSSLRMLRRAFSDVGALHPVFIALSATAFIPVVNGFVQGTDSLLMLLVVTSSLTLLMENRDVAAGAVLATGLVKFHFALPLAVLLAVRRPKLLLGFAPVAAGLVAVSARIVGWSGMAEYVRLVFRLEKSGAGGAIIAAGMPNLRGLIGALTGLNEMGRPAFLLTIGCSLISIGAAAWQIRRPEASIRFWFALGAITTIMVSFHTLTYDLTVLLLVVLLLVSMPERTAHGKPSADLIFLVTVYSLLLASSVWPWLGPFWVIPVLPWIFWKCGPAVAQES